MFQSEHLQEKWAPLLNHEGCDKIQDPHRRAVTAVLLENQEKFLREQNAFNASGSFLAEAPNVNTDPSSTGNAGFSGSAASPVAGFDPVLISLIRREHGTATHSIDPQVDRVSRGCDAAGCSSCHTALNPWEARERPPKKPPPQKKKREFVPSV